MRRNDEREIQMESRDLKDVQSIIDIVCDIEKMGRQLNWMMERQLKADARNTRGYCGKSR